MTRLGAAPQSRGEPFVIEITLENGALAVAPSGQPKNTPFAAEIDRFFLRVAPVELLFTRDADGAVTEMIVVQGGQRSTAPKLP